LFDCWDQLLANQKSLKNNLFLKRSQISKIRPDGPKVIDVGRFGTSFGISFQYISQFPSN